MRNIFIAPKEMNDTEKMFIQLMSKTHDSYGVSTETLCTLLNVSPRKIRTMMELWNNFKYLNVTPTFKISKLKTNEIGSKRLYRKIDINSTHRDLMLYKAKLDKIEYIMKDYYTRLMLGEVNTLNQIDIEAYTMKAKLIEEQINALEVE